MQDHTCFQTRQTTENIGTSSYCYIIDHKWLCDNITLQSGVVLRTYLTNPSVKNRSYRNTITTYDVRSYKLWFLLN